MNLQDKYEAIFASAKPKILTEKTYFDRLIDDVNDKRSGITLLIRPNRVVVEKINEVLSDFKKIEPQQYYYPDTDIHVTGLSIISCYPDFDYRSIDINQYIEVIKQSLKTCKPFSLNFRGLTASLDCVMCKGFYDNSTLDLIRNNLRKDFLKTSLQQSLDKRYTLETAHSTILRLRAPLQDKKAYIEVIEKYKEYDFGTWIVDEMELVFNDWYQKSTKVVLLHKFEL